MKQYKIHKGTNNSFNIQFPSVILSALNINIDKDTVSFKIENNNLILIINKNG